MSECDDEWVRKVELACRDCRGLTFDSFISDLRNEIEELGSRGSSFFYSTLTEIHSKPKDWGEENLKVFFFHRKILPPYHNFHVEYISGSNYPWVIIEYEYYWGHTASLKIPTCDALAKLFVYANSIMAIEWPYIQLEEHRKKVSSVPLLGSLLRDLPALNGSADYELRAHSLELCLNKFEDEFQQWFESRLDENARSAIRDSFEEHWADTPKELRGMYIGM